MACGDPALFLERVRVDPHLVWQVSGGKNYAHWHSQAESKKYVRQLPQSSEVLMVGKNYKPKLTPQFQVAQEIGTRQIPAQWKVSRKCLDLIVEKLSAEDLAWLKTQVIGQAICPEIYWFPDTERIRKVLGVEEPHNVTT